ncbi:hypothetical protein PROFUN_04952 [Planoprotostelium fungivorum]|uniref:Helicase-associated domain-containing protein n=1 Tax=Planoprotostelium fungivorum TaxID=1890364 RepID=A0A2P6NSR9_9EUKA|nr:hypothetical protein PROFUN_04952 [Planoprotostelium fungivorum]
MALHVEGKVCIPERGAAIAATATDVFRGCGAFFAIIEEDRRVTSHHIGDGAPPMSDSLEEGRLDINRDTFRPIDPLILPDITYSPLHDGPLPRISVYQKDEIVVDLNPLSPLDVETTSIDDHSHFLLPNLDGTEETVEASDYILPPVMVASNTPSHHTPLLSQSLPSFSALDYVTPEEFDDSSNETTDGEENALRHFDEYSNGSNRSEEREDISDSFDEDGQLQYTTKRKRSRPDPARLMFLLGRSNEEYEKSDKSFYPGSDAIEFWSKKYEELKEFKRQQGHSNPSYMNQPQLYSWLHRQKNNFRKGKLNEERQMLLSDLGVHFEYFWDDMYQQIVELKSKTGAVCVDKERDPKLFNWIWTQMNSWRSGKLSKCRIRKLEEVGVTPKSIGGGTPLKDIGKKRRSVNTIASIIHEDPEVVDMDGDGGIFGEELMFVGIMGEQFPPPKQKKSDANWKVMYKRLKQFGKEHDHVFVPIKTDKKLHLWARTQRKSKKEGKLAEWKHEKLKKIGFSFPCYHEDKTPPSAEEGVEVDPSLAIAVPSRFDEEPSNFVAAPTILPRANLGIQLPPPTNILSSLSFSPSSVSIATPSSQASVVVGSSHNMMNVGMISHGVSHPIHLPFHLEDVASDLTVRTGNDLILNQ